MIRVLFLALFGLFSLSLTGAPRESLSTQEMRIEFQELTQKLHAHRVDIDLLQDKLETLQSTFNSFKESEKSTTAAQGELEKEKSGNFDKRLAALEKSQKTLTTDLKLLKDHINETTDKFAKLSADITGVKSTLQMLVSCLEGEKGTAGKIYTVQSGDTLDKIALKHHISLKTLKELNGLTTDKIFSGQKLSLPN